MSQNCNYNLCDYNVSPLCLSLLREIINLDVSSMLSWVSQLTHGGAQQTYEVCTGLINN